MTSKLTNRRVVLSTRPKGAPQADHFTLEDVPVPPLNDGEVLIKNQFWSVDPAMRASAMGEGQNTGKLFIRAD